MKLLLLDVKSPPPHGKIAHQIFLDELNLPTPKSVAFPLAKFTLLQSSIVHWLNRYRTHTFSLRLDHPNTKRCLSSYHNLSCLEVISYIKSLTFDPNYLVLIHALDSQNMERDRHSIQYIFYPTTLTVTFEIRHDLATILAREACLPDETFSTPINHLLTQKIDHLTSYSINHRQLLLPKQLLSNFHRTLLRFGRLEIERAINYKIPKIENLWPSVIYQTIPKQLQLLFPLINTETSAFLQTGHTFSEFNLPSFITTKSSFYDLLLLLGFFNLGNFSRLRPNYDRQHTMKNRLNRLLSGKPNSGYQSPTLTDYQHLLSHAKLLAKHHCLQNHLMPKLSIVNSPAGHKFIYWDLIPSGF